MIRFSKYIWLYFFLSSLILVPGVYSLVRYGLRPSIDFTGGTLMEVRFSKAVDDRALMSLGGKAGVTVSGVQSSGPTTYLLRIKPDTEEHMASFEKLLNEFSGGRPEILRNETVGPVLGKELLTKASYAALAAILVILTYVAYAFKNIRFGVAAILALVHDLLVVLGSFALLGHFLKIEVDTLFVTAFLTTMSFSVHDTIVVFDRIREYRKRDFKTPFQEISDQALTETMGRSMANSFTIIFMLFALFLMGGDSVHWFIAALLIGTVSGTYSSPFIATPILVLWYWWDEKKRKARS